jgi:hypothetical protein
MSEQWTPPPAPTWEDLANEGFRLSAENARLREALIAVRTKLAEYGWRESVDWIDEILNQNAERVPK